MGGTLESVLTSVPAWTVYLLVFVLPFVECSLFVGFVFPAETSLILAGVLASGAFPEGDRVSLPVLCVLATLGAVLGDSAGYAIGRRYGPAVQRSRLGRVVGPARWRSAEAFLLRRGGPAVFFGRFTALLRALVPSAAGMSGLPFATFFVWNAVGGLLWANLCVVGGSLAGASYSRLESWLGRGALVVTAVVLALLLAVHLVRRRREQRELAGAPVPGGDDAPTSAPSAR